MATKRIASQVHKQASRLLREGYFQREPAWYRAVLDHPPLPLPARESAPRTVFDVGPDTPLTRPADKKGIAPLKVEYVEDQLRRQFFRDHPFEAFREKTLVEGGAIESEHPIRGLEWKRLRQRGRNPSPEDAIQYAVNLHEHHGVDLSSAYSSAVAQFRSLRSELHVMRTIALSEADHNGVQFGPSQIEIAFQKEEKAFATFSDMSRFNKDDGKSKKWKAVIERSGPPPQWTQGQEYTRLWKQGVRPDYSAVLAEPPATTPEASANLASARTATSADFVNAIPQRA